MLLCFCERVLSLFAKQSLNFGQWVVQEGRPRMGLDQLAAGLGVGIFRTRLLRPPRASRVDTTKEGTPATRREGRGAGTTREDTTTTIREEGMAKAGGTATKGGLGTLQARATPGGMVIRGGTGTRGGMATRGVVATRGGIIREGTTREVGVGEGGRAQGWARNVSMVSSKCFHISVYFGPIVRVGFFVLKEGQPCGKNHQGLEVRFEPIFYFWDAHIGADRCFFLSHEPSLQVVQLSPICCGCLKLGFIVTRSQQCSRTLQACCSSIFSVHSRLFLFDAFSCLLVSEGIEKCGIG